MPETESRLTSENFVQALTRARKHLRPPVVRERVWPPLAAALFFAVCAMSFATAAILAPPVQIAPFAKPTVQ